MSKTQTINTLKYGYEVLAEKYHDSVDTLTRPEMNELVAQIKESRKKLSDEISAGAVLCPACAVSPIGMLLREEYVDKNGLHPRIYEVGCVSCDRRCQSADAEDAVARWNMGDYLVKPTAK